jgi:acetyltransferase-like isoleucine patch superfamily enzyme
MNMINTFLKSDNLTRRHLAYAVKLVHDDLHCRLHTIAARLRLWWWQVPCGDNLRSYGKLRLHLSPRAQMTIGNNCTFRSAEWSNSAGLNRSCFLSASGDGRLFIGDHCGFSGAIVSSSTHIEIGNRVLMGANCTIIDSNRHPLPTQDRVTNSGTIQTAPIIIEDDVFLGMNVVVLQGVTIGKGSVIAANAVVVRSIPAGVIAAGVPAKIIASL